MQDQACHGEIQLRVEFPKVFDGEIVFSNFSQDSTFNTFTAITLRRQNSSPIPYCVSRRAGLL
ncbi:MAG: hypothetical protein AAF394_10395, partial [Planctomycetota bacterium]